jgi:hypothetical protein
MKERTMNSEQFAELYSLKTRKDADGSKIISGKFGHIYEYGGGGFGVMVMPNPPRKQYWGHTKAAFLSSYLHIVQDGDGEGAATFNPMDAEQVKQAIRAAGIKRIRTVSPALAERFVQPILYA